jgi:beta-fructofuranosidase
MWGWLRGFKEGLGWNGCLSLPRTLSLDQTGDLAQSPAPELGKLRTDQRQLGAIPFEEGTNSLAGDMDANVELAGNLVCSATNGLALRVIRHARAADAVNFTAAELGLATGTNALRIFIDRSVVEVFANNRKCASRILPGSGDVEPQLVLTGGTAEFRDATLWHIPSIWK